MYIIKSVLSYSNIYITVYQKRYTCRDNGKVGSLCVFYCSIFTIPYAYIYSLFTHLVITRKARVGSWNKNTVSAKKSVCISALTTTYNAKFREFNPCVDEAVVWKPNISSKIRTIPSLVGCSVSILLELLWN